jgi:hypothetical protein
VGCICREIELELYLRHGVLGGAAGGNSVSPEKGLGSPGLTVLR